MDSGPTAFLAAAFDALGGDTKKYGLWRDNNRRAGHNFKNKDKKNRMTGEKGARAKYYHCGNTKKMSVQSTGGNDVGSLDVSTATTVVVLHVLLGAT